MMHSTDHFLAVAGVRSMANEDGGVLINVDSGLVYSLNVVGAHIWRKIEEHREGLTIVELFDCVRADFDGVDEERLRGDLEAFVTGLKEKGLLQNGGPGVAQRTGSVDGRGDAEAKAIPAGWPPDFNRSPAEGGLFETGPAGAGDTFPTGSLAEERPGVFETLMAFIGLAAVDVVLRLGGFGSVYRAVKRWPVSRRRRPTRNTIVRVRQAVDRACIFYIKRALCLQRSALTTCLLRMQGVPADMVIACRKMPFHGHAWVEVNGEVVNDKTKVQEYYSVLDRF